MFIKKFIFLLVLVISIQILRAQKSSSDFVTTWKTDNPGLVGNDSTIYLNIDSNYTYNYEVDWNNDGVFDTSGVTGGILHQYDSPGIYTIRIKGVYPSIQFGSIFFFNFQDNKSKLIEINQWGNQPWKSLIRAFMGCDSMNCVAIDAPNLDSANSLWATFANCSSFNGYINHWDVSNIENLSSTFSRAFLFNQPLNNWDVSRVKRLTYTFYNAHSFNQNINSWQVDSVLYFPNMFTSARSFNQPLNNWNVSRGINLSAMFSYAESFNQNINSWDISNASIIGAMFVHAKNYNQPMNNWDVSNQTSLSYFFYGAENFNQDISSWNTSYVNSISQMFMNAKNFNQNLANWNLNSLAVAYEVFDSSGMSTENYDSTLIGWNSKYHNNNVTVGAKNINYCSSISARNSLILDGWSFVGDTIESTCISTGINDLIKNSSFYFYPNPSRGNITIELNQTEVSTPLLIYNQMGQLVKEEVISKGINQIDLRDLPNGLYFIKYGERTEKLLLSKQDD